MSYPYGRPGGSGSGGPGSGDPRGVGVPGGQWVPGPVRKLLTVCLCGCCPGRLV